MYQQREGFFQGHGSHRLFFQTWEKKNPCGHILITHGQAEHSECYNRLLNAFDQDNWSFWAWDLRGHGRSDGRRGYAYNFEDYVLDYQAFLELFMTEHSTKNLPVVLLSHSMGGLIQLKTCLEQPQLKIAAQVYSSPLLGVAVQVPAWKETAAAIAQTLAPKLTLWNEIRPEQLTRDLDVIKEYQTDTLRHDRISPGVYLGMKSAMDFVHARAQFLDGDLLFLLPEKDQVVSTPRTLDFIDNITLGKKTLKMYGEDARHELFNDLCREQVFKDLKDYLKKYEAIT